MARYIRLAAILAKIESTYGVNSMPSAAANAMLVSDFNINFQAENVPRDLVRPFMGGSEHLVGRCYVELTFSVEFAGSGAAGTAPAYGPLLRACGFTETVTASTRTEYNLTTPVTDSVSINYHIDGIQHRAIGCRGTVAIKMGISQRPMLEFRFVGLDGQVVEQANATLDTSAFKTPFVVTNANSADITFGGTYASTPNITGGTVYPSQGLDLDLGNTVNMVPLLGGDAVDVVAREVTGKIAVDLTAAQEVTFTTAFKANTVQSLGLKLGNTAGYKVLAFMPAVQLLNPAKIDYNGRLLIGYDLRAIPSASTGNDELKLVVY